MNGLYTLKRCDIGALRDVCAEISGIEGRLIKTVLLEKTFDAMDYGAALCVGYQDQGSLGGFACGAVNRELSLGSVRLLYVAQGYRNRGIGGSLLAEIESRITSMGQVSSISMMAMPGNYLTPGVDPFNMDFSCFVERHGYQWVGTAQNLIASTATEHRPVGAIDRVEKLGYRVVRATTGIAKQVLIFCKHFFPRWVNEVQRSLQNEPPTIHVCWYKQEIVALACCESNNVGTGVLGPFGVDPGHRGKGIGGVLLHRCVGDLRKLGFGEYSMAWTNPALNWFFKREFGAQRNGVYWIYEKRLA